MKLLITGGAGYIGSHMAKYLRDLGHEITILDDLSTGNEFVVNDYELLRINLLDVDSLSNCFKGRNFDGVFHFAAKSIVSESTKRPVFYYQNNFVGTLNLVREMISNDIGKLVFSSTAAIFGSPQEERISESHPKVPINPYGMYKVLSSLISNSKV